MTDPPAAVSTFAERLARLGVATDLLVAGSLALGDYVPGVSDADLVAIVSGPVDAAHLHEDLEPGLGCIYVEEKSLADVTARHPTWTHGTLIDRPLSALTRAELVRHGFAVYGRQPAELFPRMSDDDVRAAARSELCGYWAWAARRPYLWLDPAFADLGLTAMARGRATIASGRLLTKSEAVEQVRAPAWLVDQLRARRRGERAPSPRLRTAWIAWRDARKTIRSSCNSSHEAA